MALEWSRHPLLIASALASCCLTVACSGTLQGEPGAVGSAGSAPAAIGVETSSSFVTVENRAGLPLVDVRIALKPPSGTLFTKFVSRLESAAKLDLSLAEFRSVDGTTFTQQRQRPRQVIVTATDLVGKKYDVTVPWK